MDSPVLISRTDRWLVFSKPAGWLSIPPSTSSPQTSPVISTWAKENYGPVWTVHRLDLETSGIILFARSAEAHRLAGTWFQKHEVKKIYHCLCEGELGVPLVRISSAIRGTPAATQVESKESYREGFLAQVRPLTGRRHQIRIHLSGRGNPLWGDREYHGPAQITFSQSALAISRVALHAASLELPGGERFEAPWPADFAEWVNRLRTEGHRV